MNRRWLVAFAAILLPTAAHAVPSAHCVVVRQPTRQQMKESAADVQRLLEEYYARSRNNGAWQTALVEVFNRFPVPFINVLITEHQAAWRAPSRKLLAYVEATRQNPADYAEPEAVEQTINDINLKLIPDIQWAPVLVIEARGVVRRQEVARLDVQINEQACTGSLIDQSASPEVSWVHDGRRLRTTVAPERTSGSDDRCIAIDGDRVGPCNGKLKPVEVSAAESPPSLRPPPPSKPSPERSPEPPPNTPSLNYALAATGLAVAVAGFAVAAVSYSPIRQNLNEAKCPKDQCSHTEAGYLNEAINQRTAYLTSGIVGLVGVAAMLASPYRYYADWFLPASESTRKRDSARTPHLVPIVTAQSAGLFVQSEF